MGAAIGIILMLAFILGLILTISEKIDSYSKVKPPKAREVPLPQIIIDSLESDIRKNHFIVVEDKIRVLLMLYPNHSHLFFLQEKAREKQEYYKEELNTYYKINKFKETLKTARQTSHKEDDLPF